MDVVKPPRFALGDKIRVILHPEVTGFIVGFYGPIAPNSEQAYSMRLPRKPKSRYTIVTEGQIELAEPTAAVAAPEISGESANLKSADCPLPVAP